MRKTTFVFGAGAALASLYLLIAGDETAHVPPRSEGARSEPVPPARAHDETLLRALVGRDVDTQPSGEEAELRSQIGRLEARLAAVEELAGDDSAKERAPGAEQKKIPTTADESEMSSYIDEAIDREGIDRHWTQEVRGQLKERLATIPGVSLGEIDCGKRYCRASLTGQDGKTPDIESLIGTPPMAGDSFTLIDPSGALSVYFGKQGESVEALRNEVFASAQR